MGFPNSIPVLFHIFLFVAGYLHNGKPVLKAYLRKYPPLKESNPFHFVQHSLFPDIPPYIRFKDVTTTEEYTIPAEIGEALIWRRSPILSEGGFIVHEVINASGIPSLPYSKMDGNTKWFGYWHEYAITSMCPDCILQHPWQKLNLFQAHEQIDFKDLQHFNMKRLSEKHGRSHFPFHFETYVLPEEQQEFRDAWAGNDNKFWIMKPPRGFASIGITVIDHWNQVPPGIPLVIQKYLENPYLLKKRKVELRMYVLLTSIHPLRIYVYRDGITKMGMKDFNLTAENKQDPCLHTRDENPLKNCQTEDEAQENFHLENYLWRNSKTMEKLKQEGVDTEGLMATINDAIIKTFISVEKPMWEAFREKMPNHYSSFHLWAFDFLIDSGARPWLIEVNALPSLNIIYERDVSLKFPMITELLNIVGFHFPPFLSEAGRTVLRKSFDLLNRNAPLNLTFQENLYKYGFSESIWSHNVSSCASASQLSVIHHNSDELNVLKLAEDELSRAKNFQRIFPTPNMHQYMKFVESNTALYCLFAAWEKKYGTGLSRKKSIERLRAYV